MALSILAAAAPAGAANWTQINSDAGSSEITAIEYQSDTRFWFTTAQGEIFTRQANGSFQRTFGPSFVRLNDIEFQDGGGNIGLAVGNGGQVLRSVDGGATWQNVNTGPAITVSANNAHSTFPNCTMMDPLGDVNSVRFASNSRVWIFAEGSQMARSQPGTAADVGMAGTWVDANDIPNSGGPYDSDDTCKISTDIYGTGLADGFFAPTAPDVGYIVAASFSTVFFTTNDLATAGQKRPADGGNAGAGHRNLAGDPSNLNRMWSVSPDPYGLSTAKYTEDGYATSSTWTIANASSRAFPTNGPFDVDFSGGTVLSAGDDGMILNSVDGRTFNYVDAGGSLATEGWRAVGLADATHGAVGGTGGVLALSTDANAPPAPGGGGSSGSGDKTPPNTKIRKVKVKGTTARVTFSGSDPAARLATASASGLSFKCKLDKGKFNSCRSPKKLKHLKLGKHKVQVEAIDQAGNVDPTPAKKKFKI